MMMQPCRDRRTLSLLTGPGTDCPPTTRCQLGRSTRLRLAGTLANTVQHHHKHCDNLDFIRFLHPNGIYKYNHVQDLTRTYSILAAIALIKILSGCGSCYVYTWLIYNATDDYEFHWLDVVRIIASFSHMLFFIWRLELQLVKYNDDPYIFYSAELIRLGVFFCVSYQFVNKLFDLIATQHMYKHDYSS